MTELEKSIDKATREFFTWKKKYNEIRLNHNLNYGNDVPLTIKFMLSREDPSHSVSITSYSRFTERWILCYIKKTCKSRNII